MDYKTKREALTEIISNFFRSLGIDPFIGFTWILGLFTIYRIISVYKVIKDKEEYDFYDKAYDILLIVAIIYFILLHKVRLEG
jgi:hypothetical protein